MDVRFAFRVSAAALGRVCVGAEGRATLPAAGIGMEYREVTAVCILVALFIDRECGMGSCSMVPGCCGSGFGVLAVELDGRRVATRAVKWLALSGSQTRQEWDLCYWLRVRALGSWYM